ncbi:GNAT family N-acetyltransferase [Bradyrhizobium sp. STM 3809]|uniref:GNAT family N-acetyltransferase n=1 Tax=Bradyrhizobium sp. STM 3809 TaxID=551936 RepID=UPI0002409377|nr:GNAT family N-acetyltransferase [Bradyrhizobium sp. STM 3809]CCE01387.1 putative Acetyltransferase, GNAT family [Bradyrhizobium sp. STM 3809]
MIIRDATPDDAAAACAVVRASIIELCLADHRGDPDILGRWLANKTPETVATWADGQGRSLLVAVEEGAVLAVGGLAHPNEITVNYVSPQARFRGVSSALVAALEQRAIALGAQEIALLSTETAHRFYLARGYVDVGVPVGKFGTAASYPMRKVLGRAP